MKTNLLYIALVVLLASCGNAKRAVVSEAEPVNISFNADSAYAFCRAQCDFGARTMNSDAHERCGEWIADKFRQYGCEVMLQKATLKGYDNTPLRSTNIIATRPAKDSAGTARVLICAHWDSRPWADNDPDSANWHKPVLAANDGASGVAVMLELARQIQANDSLRVGVDFVCFDAEDWGVPQWSDQPDDSDSWALGAQYWAANQPPRNYDYAYGILLDMVGGQAARFYYEGFSKEYARSVVDKVWRAAQTAGYGSWFPKQDGGYITDDHVPVNQIAKIPCIDIIAYYPQCRQSSFGPTWHTVSDDMEHIDRNTLMAVGQTLLQVLYSE